MVQVLNVNIKTYNRKYITTLYTYIKVHTGTHVLLSLCISNPSARTKFSCSSQINNINARLDVTHNVCSMILHKGT